MRTRTICEIAFYINKSNILSFTCPGPIIKIHMRVTACYCQLYDCLLSQLMNEARINVIDFVELRIIWATAIDLWHFTSLSKHNMKVSKDKCLLGEEEKCIITTS